MRNHIVCVGRYENSSNCWEVFKSLQKLGYNPKLIDTGFCLSFKVFSTPDYDEAYDKWVKLNSQGFDTQILNM